MPRNTPDLEPDKVMARDGFVHVTKDQFHEAINRFDTNPHIGQGKFNDSYWSEWRPRNSYKCIGVTYDATYYCPKERAYMLAKELVESAV